MTVCVSKEPLAKLLAKITGFTVEYGIDKLAPFRTLDAVQIDPNVARDALEFTGNRVQRMSLIIVTNIYIFGSIGC